MVSKSNPRTTDAPTGVNPVTNVEQSLLVVGILKALPLTTGPCGNNCRATNRPSAPLSADSAVLQKQNTIGGMDGIARQPAFSHVGIPLLDCGPPNRSSAVCMCRLAIPPAMIRITRLRPSSMLKHGIKFSFVRYPTCASCRKLHRQTWQSSMLARE